MNQINGFNLDFALLTWVRLQFDLSKKHSKELELMANLKKLEEYLYIYGIENLSMIHKTPELYTIEFMKDGVLELIDFSTEEVEKFY